ncbi:MAG TPA: putative toxin-antitoxin system toxin component, PIN family [Pyrinomonadaceae bacterium]|nr:putative toxin-antitoxin system toxin component, PIN family [Pyrinomonadaceae bacterium]
MKDKPRVVFDCNVLLQAAAREKSVAAKCLNMAESGHVQLCVSREVLAEVEEVLNRPEIRAHFQDLTDEIVGAFLQRLQKLSVLVRPIPKKFSYPRDEDDEPYINLAVEVGADFIISRDRDLLDLMTGHSTECKEFRQRFRTLRVVEPLDFLKFLEETEIG